MPNSIVAFTQVSAAAAATAATATAAAAAVDDDNDDADDDNDDVIRYLLQQQLPLLTMQLPLSLLPLPPLRQHCCYNLLAVAMIVRPSQRRYCRSTPAGSDEALRLKLL